MIIGIDANEANVARRVGSGTYTYHLLNHWSKTQKHDFHLYLRDKVREGMPGETKNWHYHLVRPRKIWLNFSLPLHLLFSKPKPAVFFSPAHYSPPITRSKLVVTIHDLAYEYYPELFLPRDLYKLKNWTTSSLKRAASVIAVSMATKKDIIKKYGLDPDTIHVVYNGYDTENFNADIKVSAAVLKKYDLTPPYILYVGTIQPRKNLLKLVHAFEKLRSSKAYSGQLVIAGNPGWMSSGVLEQIKASKYANQIKLPGYISQEDLPYLYKAADVFTLPSLYEGFGIPLLESMAVGTPVAASNNSSLPEVVGDAGALFDPVDPQDIAIALKTVLDKRGFYANKGLKRVKDFSWQKAARETLSVLEEASKS